MTVADKLCVEDRRAPRMPARGRGRTRRAHDPSRLCRRGLWGGCKPQQKRGDTGGLGGKRQFAACHEIELAHLAPDFQHHRAQAIAGKRIRRRPHCAVRIVRAHRDQVARVEAELNEPAHRQRTGFKFGKILPYPDQRPPSHNPRS